MSETFGRFNYEVVEVADTAVWSKVDEDEKVTGKSHEAREVVLASDVGCLAS